MSSPTPNAASSMLRDLRCETCLASYDSLEDVRICRLKHQETPIVSWHRKGGPETLSIEPIKESEDEEEDGEKWEGVSSRLENNGDSDEEKFGAMTVLRRQPLPDDHIYASGPPNSGFSFMASYQKTISARNSSLRSNISLTSPKSYQTASSTFSSYKTAPISSTKRRQPRNSAACPEHTESSAQTTQLTKIVDDIMSEIPKYAPYMNTKMSHINLWISLEKAVTLLVTASDKTACKYIVREMYATIQDAVELERDGLLPFMDDYFDKRESDEAKVFGSTWLEHLSSRGIILDPRDELDWSGKGQHVEFQEGDEIPLKTERVLGHSATAIVESVMCRRIRLARKTIRCGRRMSKEEAVTEVEQLQRIAHSHIIRVVGTYTLKSDLAILLYPVADWNLEEFMDELQHTHPYRSWRHYAMGKFISCLSNTIEWLHNKNIKHMDIKPKNILVRKVENELLSFDDYRVYIADFGIARSYQSAVEAETDSPTSYTRMYAAPEVVQQDKRGFSADIFSLGCVYMEMLASVLSSLTTTATSREHQRNELDRLRDACCDEYRDTSYQANIDSVRAWYESIDATQWHHMGFVFDHNVSVLRLLPSMIDELPSVRPKSTDLAMAAAGTTRFWTSCSGCIRSGEPEPFEAVTTAKSKGVGIVDLIEQEILCVCP